MTTATATTTKLTGPTRTIAAPIHRKLAQRGVERRSGMDRRDHEMTVSEVNARLATSFQTR